MQRFPFQEIKAALYLAACAVQVWASEELIPYVRPYLKLGRSLRSDRDDLGRFLRERRQSLKERLAAFKAEGR